MVEERMGMTDLTLISLKDDFLEHEGDRPPLGILYIASFLEKYGYSIRILDLNHDEFTMDDSSVYGISFSTPQYFIAHNLAKQIRKENKDVKIIAGGAHCSAWQKETGNPVSFNVFDQAVIGDGEIPMLNIMRGVTYRRYYSRRKYNLDIYPIPARHLVKMNRYPVGTLMSSRGCFGSCIFCSCPNIPYGFHSPERTVTEMEMLVNYGYKELYFHDDTFTIEKNRVLDICDLVKEREISVKSRVNARVDTVDEEVVTQMVDAGFETLSFGFEHANNDVLKKSGKGNQKVEDYEKVIEMCHNCGAKVYGYFILNLPGATEETARHTIQWAKDMRIERPSFYPLVAYPGTAVWSFGDKMGLQVRKHYGCFQAGRDLPSLNVENPEFPNDRVLNLLEELKCKI